MKAIREALGEIMEEGSIDAWLNRPNPSMRNKSPLELIKEGREDIIYSIIERVKQGTFL